MNSKLSIIIPVFNEKETIGEIIKRVIAASVLGYEKEIIIVDDGSSDGTGEILEKLKREFNFIFLSRSVNRGKGLAVRMGVERATGDLVLIQDADLEYNPQDYQALLSAFNQETPVVYGSRNLEKGRRGYFFYFLGGKFLTWFFNLLYGAKLTDITTGYKLFRTDIIRGAKLRAKGFEFCEEITAKVIKAGYKIKEVPINYYPRKFSQGKKIRAWHGLSALWTIIKYVGA